MANKKQKETKKTRGKIKYPFTIDACPMESSSHFPTHTHGLTEMGMPEFIMDPLAYGPQGNANIIGIVYEYLIKPENKNKLEAILNGKTIKLTNRDLIPDPNCEDPHVYCLREVTSDFQAVREAYLFPSIGIKPGMKFIQIWVEGDDFALQDEYYRGGVVW